MTVVRGGTPGASSLLRVRGSGEANAGAFGCFRVFIEWRRIRAEIKKNLRTRAPVGVFTFLILTCRKQNGKSSRLLRLRLVVGKNTGAFLIL